MAQYILAIDQGTTSSRAILFDENREIFATDQQEFDQHYPDSGWVEHEVEDIWRTVVETCRGVISKSGIDVASIAAIGITNQRETTIVWDKHTGEAVHRAIVWQDRRTAEYCASLKDAGHEAMVTAKTGLLLDPYFSSTKLRWILENIDGVRARAEAGDLLFGTVDCYLLWKLTGGKSHKTDATNAARTALFNIHDHCWDEELCALLGIPMGMLPEVEDCAADFGETEAELLGKSIPVLGMAGDQQAALVGQACFQPGMLKSTYGTGCFAILNTGDKPVSSSCKLLTTIGYRLDGKTTYALEGSIFIAGAAVQWLRDGIKIIDDAAQSGGLAEKADTHQDVILVPAFAGLGAPYWEPNVRGAMFGMTRNTSRAEFAKATLESVCFQTRDLVEAMQQDYDFDVASTGLRVDGGMVASDWTMQSLANILGGAIDRPVIFETTALGAAWLAGMKAGIWPDMEDMQTAWQLDRQFTPSLDEETRENRYRKWQVSVQAAIAQSRG